MVFTYRKDGFKEGDTEEKGESLYTRAELASAFKLEPNSIRIKNPDGLKVNIENARDNVVYTVFGDAPTSAAPAGE